MRKFRIKKSSADYQVGNFVYHEEADMVKVSAVSGVCSHRVSKIIAKGRQLSLYLEGARGGDENAQKALEMYAVCVFNMLCTAFDPEYLYIVDNASVECMKRHKELYGIKDEVTEESEKEDLEAARETEALDREIREKVLEEEGE